MKFRTAVYIILIPVLSCVVCSCTPNSCQESTISTVKAGFYQTGTGEALTADSVTLYGLGMESARIYNKATKLKNISFPLNAKSDTSILVMRINGVNDTLTVVYTSYPHLVSKECGFTFYHILDTVYNTRADLDILKKNQNITTLNEENIRIYY